MIKVKVLAHTPNPENVVATSARLCYSDLGIDDLFNKYTDEQNQKMIQNLMSLGHESPIEHVSFTFGIEGVSRSLSHQLVRHRIASYSQQSQRYVKENQFEYIIPHSIKANNFAKNLYEEKMADTQEQYNILKNILMIENLYKNHYQDFKHAIHLNKEYFGVLDIGLESAIRDAYYTMIAPKNIGDIDNSNYEIIYKSIPPKILSKIEKEAIEDARYIFPNAIETKLVFTMNIRSLLNFFRLRCCNRAQWEIRELADKMLIECKNIAPNLFKYGGATCMFGKCPEGKMTCGKPRKVSEYGE